MAKWRILVKSISYDFTFIQSNPSFLLDPESVGHLAAHWDDMHSGYARDSANAHQKIQSADYK